MLPSSSFFTLFFLSFLLHRILVSFLFTAAALNSDTTFWAFSSLLLVIATSPYSLQQHYAMMKIFSLHSSSSYMHQSHVRFAGLLCVLILSTLFIQYADARYSSKIHGHRMSLPSSNTYTGHPPPPPPPVQDHDDGFGNYDIEARTIPTGPNPLHNWSRWIPT